MNPNIRFLTERNCSAVVQGSLKGAAGSGPCPAVLCFYYLTVVPLGKALDLSGWSKAAPGQNSCVWITRSYLEYPFVRLSVPFSFVAVRFPSGPTQHICWVRLDSEYSSCGSDLCLDIRTGDDSRSLDWRINIQTRLCGGKWVLRDNVLARCFSKVYSSQKTAVMPLTPRSLTQ